MPRTIAALILREMATTHGRSPGGYLWAVLEPVAALSVLTVVFSLVLRSPSLGTSFPLFYATGYLPFMLFNDVAAKIAGSIKFSRPLLTYPSVNFVDALLARLLLTALTHVMIGYLIFSGIILLSDTRTILSIMPILVAFTMATMFGFGV
ncbi:MAG: sugar ABC transporter permease, partial [Pseudorhodobacter sp.]|nr:sugar ABC transporter permease [Pseudorhodobacter sp.]